MTRCPGTHGCRRLPLSETTGQALGINKRSSYQNFRPLSSALLRHDTRQDSEGDKKGQFPPRPDLPRFVHHVTYTTLLPPPLHLLLKVCPSSCADPSPLAPSHRQVRHTGHAALSLCHRHQTQTHQSTQPRHLHMVGGILR